MERYVRLCRTTNDKGILIPAIDVEDVEKRKAIINSYPNDAWYRSLYHFGKESQTYYKQNNNSIAGYPGNAWSNKLLFDLDYESDPTKAKADVIKLLNKLVEKGVDVKNNTAIFFSGKKGFHVEVLLDIDLSYNVLKDICSNIAIDAGLETFDSKVYDKVRLIRLPDSKHQDTKLYKIQLTTDDIKNLSFDQIKINAGSLGKTYPIIPTKDSSFVNEYKVIKKAKKISLTPVSVNSSGIRGLSEIEFKQCPPNTPRCIFALSKGIMVPMSVESAWGGRSKVFFRLATYYRNQGLEKEVTYRLLKGIAELNLNLYPDAEEISNDEIWQQHIASAYSKQSLIKQNPGGAGTSQENDIIRQYCEAIDCDKKCTLHGDSTKSVVQIDKVLGDFGNFVANFDKNTVKTGIKFIDDNMNISVGTANLLVGACGCHRKGEKVMMYDGSLKKVEEVKVGEKLMGPDSKPRTVLQLKYGKESMYEVTFDKGKIPKNKPKYFNESHKLHFFDGNKKEIHQITIKDYINNYPEWKKDRSYFLRTPINFKEQDINIDPYFLGLWLGDGTSLELAISTIDSKIKDYIYYIGDKYNLKVYNKENRNGKCPTYRLSSGLLGGNKSKNKLWEEFIKLNLKGNKHIPDSYMVNSKKNRLELLAGILDTDGHLHNNVFEITQKNKHLSEQIQKLCFSLGYQSTIKCVEKSDQNGTKGIYYRIHISGNVDEIPTKLDNKRANKRVINKNVNHLSFNIKKVNDNEEYFGFTVDKDNLYIDDDCLIIRNSGKTTVALNMMEQSNKLGQHTMFFSLDMNKNLVLLKLATKLTDYDQDEVIEIYKNQEIEKIKEIRSKISENYGKTFFDFSTTLTLEQMRDRVLKTEQETGKKIKLVVVDYASRITSDKADRYSNSTHNALKSVEVAVDTDAAWIFISQISRNTGDGSNPLRTKRAAKESGDWEEAASNVITLWRPFMGMEGQDDIMRMFLAKNRMGREIERPLWWDGAKATVTTMGEEEYSVYRDEREQDEIEIIKSKYNKRIN